MSEAVIGLIGVIVGAVCAGGVQYAIGWRGEHMEARAAARLVQDAFLQASHVSGSRWREIYDFSGAVEDWREHRGVLARVLTNEEWWAVAHTAQTMISVSGARRGEVLGALGLPAEHGASRKGRTPEEAERSVLGGLARDLRLAAESLARLAEGRQNARVYARFRKSELDRNAERVREQWGA